MQGKGFGAAHMAGAHTTRASDVAGLAEAGLQALTGEFEQAKAGDLADLDAGAIGVQGIAQAVFHGTLVLGVLHVDEVDDHQAAQVAQTQLACGLIGRFQVGVERGLLNVGTLGRLSRVDIDGDEGLGVVDDQRATGG